MNDKPTNAAVDHSALSIKATDLVFQKVIVLLVGKLA
jgi:hypothetical protein